MDVHTPVGSLRKKGQKAGVGQIQLGPSPSLYRLTEAANPDLPGRVVCWAGISAPAEHDRKRLRNLRLAWPICPRLPVWMMIGRKQRRQERFAPGPKGAAPPC